MNGASTIIDPSARFIDSQQEDLVDFIFRLTADRSRAAVMGREACRQMMDELSSQLDEESIKTRLFQLAYDMNEEVLRPLAKSFFEHWYRHQHADPRSVAAAFRWEVALLELGQHAALLLLLKHRFGFSALQCAEILNRDEADVKQELAILEEILRQDQSLDLDHLKQLPRYGFMDVPEEPQTTLSQIRNQFKSYQRRWARLALLLALAMFGGFLWAVSAYLGFSKLWHFFRLWLIGS